MSSVRSEWALVPTGARVTAVLVYLALAGLVSLVFVINPTAGPGRSPLGLWPFLTLALIACLFLPLFVLLVGYVWGDAKRRGMNHVLWMLLSIFIPNAIGIILYFILRDPIPVPCPSCGTPARKGHAYCAACGAPVCSCCPQCKKPVDRTWTHCVECGVAVRGMPAASGGV
jgi:hypothetical protein